MNLQFNILWALKLSNKTVDHTPAWISLYRIIWTPDHIVCCYSRLLRKICLLVLNSSWLQLDWARSWIWLRLDWCGPNYHPDITAGGLPGCPVRAGWLDGLVRISENRRRKSAGAARACSFERGVLGSVWNLCLIRCSNCAILAGRQEASPPQIGA